MMKLPLLSALLISIFSQAQLAKHVTLYFDNNVYVLNQSQKQQLDSLTKSLSNIPEAYTVEVTGHTNRTGSLKLNEKISKDRGNAVLSYLKGKHFKTTRNSLNFFAFNQPLATDDNKDTERNRRVEIEIYTRQLDMPKILGIKDFLPVKFKLIEDEGGTVTYDSTKITIPADAFLHQDGSPVSGEIEVQYQEYREPADFLLSGIPMSLNNDDSLSHFNSAGMFRIRVFQNKEELVLKSGTDKNIIIDLPLTDFTDQKFYGFDTLKHAWNESTAIPITDAHGNMLPPFGTGASVTGDSSQTTPVTLQFCMTGKDTCTFMTSMVNKLNYFLSHEEPLRSDYPYKFFKNNVVDFKSPIYQLVYTNSNEKFQFVSRNSHNKLGVFSDYEWTMDEKEEKSFKWRNDEGYSFIKITHAGSSRFRLNIDGRLVSLKGTPKDYDKAPQRKLFSFTRSQKNKEKNYAKNLKKVNRKNFKKYQEDARALDTEELALEQELKMKTGLDHDFTFSKSYLIDSLKCLNSFYNAFLLSIDTTVQPIQNFNLRKDILAKKMRIFPTPFTCDDARKFIIQKNEEYKALIEKERRDIEKRRSVFASFRLPSTGLFNADQVQSIRNARTIKASYEDEQGNPLKIISIYVNISSLNGIICYNGYANYSPYRFAYGKKDRTMIVAVDDQEKSYYCTAEEFDNAVKNNEDRKVVFKVKPLNKLETTGALKKIVSRLPPGT